jgi:16S rRNA (adenine1518-N6/adenine1519-N6)-dimethyltransferase
LIVAKKSLGQHWLINRNSLQAVVDAGNLSKNDVVLEVGPGEGVLTKPLCNRASRVIAVELDEDLVRLLPKRVRANNLEIIYEDILKFDTTILPKNYKVVANIPYYLTSHLIRTLLESLNPPSMMVLLMQKEVAERIAAKPGAMSMLSVSAQFYTDTELKQVVPADHFDPIPKVDSQIIVLNRLEKPRFQRVDTKQFFQVVRAGFSARRKKLRSSLSGGLQIPKQQIDQILELTDIDENARAQELSLAQWYELYKIIIENK